MNASEVLDYEIVKNCDGWEDKFQVWTPDTTGAIIGFGNTRSAAVRNAIATLGLTVALLVDEIKTAEDLPQE